MSAPDNVRGVGRLLHNPALRAIGTMAGATGTGQVAIMATLPIVTRLYDPASYGLFSLISAFVGVASVGACLCLDLAIVQGSTPEAADELCAAAIFTTPITATLSACVMWVLVTGGYFSYGQLPWWSALIVGLMVGLNGVYVASRYRLLREQRYRQLAQATLAQSGGRALAPVGWALVLPDWSGLSLGELTGRLLGVRGLLRPILPQLRANDAWCSPGAWARVVRRETRYTVILLGSVLVDSTASLLIAPLLAWAYGAKAAGEYFLVATLLVAPSALIGTATADVIHTRGARLYVEAPQELPAFLRTAARWLLIAGCAVYIPVYLLAPAVFPVVFGHRWTLIAPISQAMTPFMIVAFVASPCSRMLVALGQTGWKAVSDVLRLVGTPAVVAGALYMGWQFETAMWALAWFLTGAYAVYFALTYYATIRSSRRAVMTRIEKNGR